MRSSTAAKVVAIYSIVFGALGLVGTLFDGDVANETGSPAFSIIWMSLFVVFGIVVLTKSNSGTYGEKGFVITLLVFYAVISAFGIILLGFPFFGPMLFLIVQILVVTPIVFSIIYLNRASKESSESSDTVGDVAELEYKLRQLENLLNKGIISQEEYDAKRKAIIENH